MVSTRGIKSKFTEGELVLCYEPDPAKAKVLYDSKVLEINVNKDDNGKKFLEFLIHFQGWSPTWDRFVTEDYVLKDTQENRQLQKELAEKAQLTTAVKFCRVGGNLYKRERKKRQRKLSEKINNSLEAKRPLVSQEQETPKGQESSSESSSEDDTLILPISDSLKKLLELDYRLITQQNKLLKLPVKNNILSILEGYVKECAVKEISSLNENEKPVRVSSSQLPKSIDSLCNKLNLLKEVADGLRVYFDFTLKDLLLYQQEREQYNRVTSFIKQEWNNCDTSVNNIVIKQEQVMPLVKQELETSPLGSPRHQSSTPNPASLPMSSPDRESATNTITGYENNIEGDRRKSLRSHRTQGGGFELTNGTAGKSLPSLSNIKESASSVTSNSSFDTGHNHDHNISGSVVSPKQDVLLAQIMSWKIIPTQVNRKGEQVLPTQVYGAVHLARLFVKLPELLQPTGMADDKMEILVQRLNEFLEYLESHKEWFGESHYADAASSIDFSDAGTLLSH